MIDEIDRQILLLLQEDARLSNAAIAEKVGLTSSSVHERVKKLERRGVIKGYVALVDPEALGKSITAFIRLTVGSSVALGYMEAKDNVVSLCREEPAVLECHGVAGEDCYILKVRVAEPQDLEKLLERIRCSGLISRSVSSIVLTTIKETTKVEPVMV